MLNAETPLMLLWAAGTFLLGALPFSVWVGRYSADRDIRDVGDKNPGASNVMRTSGAAWFVLAMVLDISKAAAPVGLAYQIFGWRGWEMWLIAMAPVLGHAFSPFLKWRGGKALATALGVWIGLTLYVVPVVIMLGLAVWVGLLNVVGWGIMLTLITIGGYLLLFDPDPLFLAVLLGQFAVLGWTHRLDLQQRPAIRARWRKRPNVDSSPPS